MISHADTTQRSSSRQQLVNLRTSLTGADTMSQASQRQLQTALSVATYELAANHPT